MSSATPSILALEEIRQANQLFLDFLRARPGVATDHFGLPPAASELLCRATPEQLGRAADFPRALFRLCLPPTAPVAVVDPLDLGPGSGRRVLQVALLLSASNLCRTSGYSARLLLRLNDDDIRRLREAELREILLLSHGDGILRAAYDELDWIWQRLLTESRPEQRRRLLLIGLQPDPTLRHAPGLA
jgi:hypothetical protein